MRRTTHSPITCCLPCPLTNGTCSPLPHVFLVFPRSTRPCLCRRCKCTRYDLLKSGLFMSRVARVTGEWLHPRRRICAVYTYLLSLSCTMTFAAGQLSVVPDEPLGYMLEYQDNGAPLRKRTSLAPRLVGWAEQTGQLRPLAVGSNTQAVGGEQEVCPPYNTRGPVSGSKCSLAMPSATAAGRRSCGKRCRQRSPVSVTGRTRLLC
jgi:hypothetical protein